MGIILKKAALLGICLLGLMWPAVGATSDWNQPGSGLWSPSSNWSGAVPLNPGDQAVFGSAITGPSTVTVDTPVSVGTMSFNNLNEYTIDGSALTLATTGGGATVTVSSGNHIITAPVVLTVDATIATASGTMLTVAGVVSGAHSVTKTGGGTLWMTGADTYAGSTTVQAAYAYVDGSIVSTTTVDSGGYLGGIGSVNAPVTVLSAGVLAPGSPPAGQSIGTLNTQDLVLQQNSFYTVQLNGPSVDCTNVTGTVTLGGTNTNSILELAVLGQPNPNDVYTIIQNDGVDAVSGIFKLPNGTPLPEGAQFTQQGYTFQISYDHNSDGGSVGNDVVLTAVPEPSTLALLGTGAIGLLASAWRRRRR